MKRIIPLSILVALLAASAGAQVRDLTGHEPTSDELIEALKPRKGAQGPERGGQRTRSIGMAPSAPIGKPCEFHKVARSRGIGSVSADSPSAGTEAVSEKVAMTIVFASNSAELSPQASRTLDELGKALSSDQLKSFCFVVEGHTDSVGSDAYNLKLSERRAQSVVRYLTSNFQIDRDRLQAVGYGKSDPIADNSTEEGRQKNRRVQVANLGA